MSDPVTRFFEDSLPAGWFGEVTVESDDDEILCVGTLPPGADVDSFRESTREERMALARRAEARFGRRVSWGVERDGVESLFTTERIPVTTWLSLRERAVLDTLVGGGVAPSRGEALTWCVKLVGRHRMEWLEGVRDALADVGHARPEGPTLL